jgi:hypothetical protein
MKIFHRNLGKEAEVGHQLMHLSELFHQNTRDYGGTTYPGVVLSRDSNPLKVGHKLIQVQLVLQVVDRPNARTSVQVSIAC